MIGLLVKIPFFGQIRKAEPRLAAQIRTAIEDAARASAAENLHVRRARFPHVRRSIQPRQAQGGRGRASSRRQPQGLESPMYAGASSSTRASWARKRTCGISNDCGMGSDRTVSFWSESPKIFERYFLTGQNQEGSAGRSEICIPVSPGAPCASPLPGRGSSPAPSGPFLERVIDELGALGIGSTSARALVILGPERAPIEQLGAGLNYLYGPHERTFMRFRSSTVSVSPLRPLMEGLWLSSMEPPAFRLRLLSIMPTAFSSMS